MEDRLQCRVRRDKRLDSTSVPDTELLVDIIFRHICHVGRDLYIKTGSLTRAESAAIRVIVSDCGVLCVS